MNHSLKQTTIAKIAVFATLCIGHQSIYAINPVQALYGGISLGGSYMPSSSFTVKNPITNLTLPGKLTRSVLGNFTADLGYRIHHYRVEGELFINSNPYQSLAIGGYTINKNSSSSTTLALGGQTTIGAFLANGFYDFYSTEEGCNVAPYVGIGIGYAYVMNSINFYYNNIKIPNSTFTYNTGAPAAQGIIGLSYFLDNFATVGIDFRYFATSKISKLDTTPQVASINLTVNGAFDCG